MLPVAVKEAAAPSPAPATDPLTTPSPVAVPNLSVPPAIVYVPSSSNGYPPALGSLSQTVPSIVRPSVPFPFLLLDVAVNVAVPTTKVQKPPASFGTARNQSAVKEDS